MREMSSSITKISRMMLPYMLVAATTVAAAVAGNEVSMGTTILAVRYAGGVIVGADTRTSVSGLVSNRHAAKLTFVLDREADGSVAVPAQMRLRRLLERGRRNEEGDDNHQKSDGDNGTPGVISAAEEEEEMELAARIPESSTCVVCRSGSAADTQHLTDVVRTEMVSRQVLHRIRGTVSSAGALLRNLLVDDPSLSASLICAGYDHELGRGVIYSIAPGGAMFEEPMWAAGGSGSSFVLGYIDSHFSRGISDDTNSAREATGGLLSEEEAIKFVGRAIHLAMERDGSSGGFVRMYVIDRLGKRFITKMPSSSNKNAIERTGRSEDSSVVLKNFAPAIPVKTNNINHSFR